MVKEQTSKLMVQKIAALSFFFFPNGEPAPGFVLILVTSLCESWRLGVFRDVQTLPDLHNSIHFQQCG